ncbi:hypothetical protein BRD20_10210 [Halobacteriales archaeon SW_8_65_20]|nr:MAG: hypothetical protein BRD20_10210 [Halobacteriales archaeon SW_8_65_20]
MSTAEQVQLGESQRVLVSTSPTTPKLHRPRVSHTSMTQCGVWLDAVEASTTVHAARRDHGVVQWCTATECFGGEV